METSEKFVPPYGVPWAAFKGQFEKMAEDGIPLRVDRSYLSDKSGNVQTYLMQGLRSFGLVDANNAPLPALVELVEMEDKRPQLMEALFRQHYAPIVKMGATNATQGQLEELWAEVFNQRGDTRRKAVRFFLSGAEYCGIPLSKMWKAPRATPSTGGRRRASNKPDGATGEDEQEGTAAESETLGDTYTVALKSGGSVTLTVSVSHFALSKNRPDRDFVNGLIDKMTDYGEVSEGSAAVGSDEPVAEVVE